MLRPEQVEKYPCQCQSLCCTDAAAGQLTASCVYGGKFQTMNHASSLLRQLGPGLFDVHMFISRPATQWFDFCLISASHTLVLLCYCLHSSEEAQIIFPLVENPGQATPGLGMLKRTQPSLYHTSFLGKPKRTSSKRKGMLLQWNLQLYSTGDHLLVSRW